MEKYKNSRSDSNIIFYEIGRDFIQVQFKDSHKIYRFSYANIGEYHVNKMKRLAENTILLEKYIRYFVLDLVIIMEQ
jgi:hypothetical protein